MRKLKTQLVALSISLAALQAQAASLQVAPVLLDVATPGDAATSITLRNVGTRPINAQVRVFKWKQVNGEDVFEETQDIAVAPAILNLRTNMDFTVRVVRRAGTPVRGEESYRLIADELPDTTQLAPGTINMVIRHSVPLFFRAPEATAPDLSWSVRKNKDHLETLVANQGDRHVRLAGLKLADKAGVSYSYGPGLTGYVLGNSEITFTSRTKVRGFARGSADVSAQGDMGPVHASAPLVQAR